MTIPIHFSLGANHHVPVDAFALPLVMPSGVVHIPCVLAGACDTMFPSGHNLLGLVHI